ncbi:hypothetical protein ACWEQU_19935 [Streptomyces nodosus]
MPGTSDKAWSADHVRRVESGRVLHIALPNGWDDLWSLPPEEFELLDDFAGEHEAAQGAQISH